MFFLAVLASVVIVGSNAQSMDLVNDPALVGLWLFDDGSGGVVTDSSGNGNDGTVNGDFAWDTGKIGGAIIASGGGSIEVPVSASLDTVTSAMTIAGWFRVDADSDTGIRRQNAFLLEDQSSSEPVPNGFSFRIWTTSGLSPGAYGTTELAQGEWYHIAGTYDSATMKLYVNGVEEAELLTDGGAAFNGEWTGDVGTPTDTLQLKYSSESLTGGMDEMVLLSRALTASEIKALMAGALSTATAVDAHGKLATTWAALRR
jgi:hypothetical protein